MSASAAKATRRDIRRAFGDAAVTTLDAQAAAIDGLKERLETGFGDMTRDTREAIAQLRAERRDWEARTDALLHHLETRLDLLEHLYGRD